MSDNLAPRTPRDSGGVGGFTTEELAALGSGADFWSTKAVRDVPSIAMTDGPHGLRKQAAGGDHLGIGASVPATCFPPAVGLAQTWDPEIVRSVGDALGAECQANDVQLLLGPGVNIKRSPLGGRNFEYYSEDPLLTGVLGTAWVRGVQGRGVGASLKHFALNNQEHDRMRVSSDVDPRPLREVYLRAFRRIVEDAAPWTVMCSYNRVNGIHVSEDPFLLTTVLRDEWGFEGAVVSDWGAVRDRTAAIAAGLDLEMPGGDPASDARIVAAAEQGRLSPEALQRSADRVAALARRGRGHARPETAVDHDAHHALARIAAGRAIVLLKNDDATLPLAAPASLAVIGEFATAPRYQGGGSSHVNATRVDIPLDELRAQLPGTHIGFARGFTTDGAGTDPRLVEEAVAAARDAGTAVVFLGLAARQESEGFDRDDLDLPDEQLDLLRQVAAAADRVVVVLSHGGVLDLRPVRSHAHAIVDAGLLGQAVGGAIADVLTGRVNPSGRLAETVPLRLEDTPAHLDFPGERRHVRYGEGLFVGYRWYDARRLDVAYPFGHGLSYSVFDYADLHVTADVEGGVLVEATITNSGDRAGREIVQAYAGSTGSAQVRPPRQLAGWAVVDLEPGESRRAGIRIERRDLEYWDVDLERFVLEGGEYQIAVGASSRDLRLTGVVDLAGDDVRVPLTMESTLGEVMVDPIAGPIIASAMPQSPAAVEGAADLGIDMARMMAGTPIERIAGFSGGAVTREQLEQLLAHANAAADSPTGN